LLYRTRFITIFEKRIIAETRVRKIELELRVGAGDNLTFGRRRGDYSEQ
jgi:hypothetical protein